MEFEWNESKREEILKKRDVDILYAALIFENYVLTRPDIRQGYGEKRLISLGLVDGDPYVVVHTERNGVTRLITAWKGGQNDFGKYQARIAGRAAGDDEPG